LPEVFGIGDLLDARGLDESLRHLLAADDEDHVVEAAGDQRPADLVVFSWTACAALRLDEPGTGRISRPRATSEPK
jgi:hypothetical protein